MKTIKFVALAIAGISSTALAAQHFKGSDTLAGAIEDAIVASGAQSDLVYDGGGSGTGEAALVAGTQTIAPMSRAFKPDQIQAAQARGIQIVEHVIGLDGIGLFVKRDNPAVKVDLPTLQKIYTCQTTTWEQVPGSNKTGPIKAYRRNDQSGTTDTFKNLVGITQFGACVTVVAETDDIAHATSTDPQAIGYAGLSGERPTNKPLQVGKTAAGPFLSPTVANIRSFAYPLSRKLYIYESKGSRTAQPAEARFLENVLDRSFMDPILQNHEFFTLN